MVESKSVGTFSPLEKENSEEGVFVDRGVGSSRLVKSASATHLPASEAKVYSLYKKKKLFYFGF